MSTNNKLLPFLEKILGPSKQYSGEEYYFRCPLCQKADGKKKLAIKLDKSAKDKDGNSIYMNWHCWRDNSHRGKNIFQLLKRANCSDQHFNELKTILGQKGTLKNFDESIKSSLTKNKNFKVIVKGLPDEFLPLREFRDNPHYKNAYRYITKDRGLSVEDIIKYNVGYCEEGKYAGYIIVPSYDDKMNVNYFVARSFYNNALKHKNPPFKKDMVFNEIFISWKKPIILCEGAFDMMAIKRNAIPILGKYIQPTLKLKILKKSVKNIYIALDRDAIKDSLNIIQEFLKNDINIFFVKMTDKDPSKLGFKEVWKLIKNATPIEFKDLIAMKLEIK